MEKMETVLAVPWKEHKKDSNALMLEEAERMFGVAGIGFNNYAYQDCKQRIIVIHQVEDLDKIQKRLLSKPLLLKAVCVKEKETRASVIPSHNTNKTEYALLVNTKASAIADEIKRIISEVRTTMSKGKTHFCCPIDINSAFNNWFKSFHQRQDGFHDAGSFFATFCAAIYLTNVMEATEGGNDETRVTTCGKCRCMHHV